MNINSRVASLRELMKKEGIDAYIVNTSDPHNSEYLADCYKTREWISGFTGSAGLALIEEDKAILWTDGRYFIQAENEIADSYFELYKMGTPGYPDYINYLRDSLKEGAVVAFDGEIFSQAQFEKLEGALEAKKVSFISHRDLIGELWEDRPNLPSSQAFVHGIEYAGKTSLEKIQEVRELMEEKDLDNFLISSLDDIAWLLNIRGRDVEFNPVIVSYALVTRSDVRFFVDESKLSEEVREHLALNKVDIYGYLEVLDHLKKLEGKKIYLDKEATNRLVYSSINQELEVVSGINFTSLLKARKNKIEIQNQKQAYIKDGLALVKFFHWIESNLGKIKITELSAENKLLEFRQEQEGFIEPSFGTISAYRENAAMMHYSASPSSDKELEASGLYLVDSGGQYLDGTTDITRTIALGPISDEERRDFTLTFKGHTNLIRARFLAGSTGHYLDVLARIPLWNEAIDYKCGTGHGVGYLLNVHEGPHRISGHPNDVALEEGMVTSIEPGVYKTDKHGIRLENIVVVREDVKNESGQFMSFDLLSFVPIDTKALDISILNHEEKLWLNNYHREVYEKLSPFLEAEELEWLRLKTREI